MSEMIERVARAICTGHGLDPESSRSLAWNVKGEPGSSYFAKGWMAYEQDARAAIAAMREPTEAMEEAGHDSGDWGPGVAIYPDADASPKGCWWAMIDTALAD